MAVGLAMERFADDYAATVRVASPWLWNGRLAFAMVGGPAWYSDLRALPDSPEGQDFKVQSIFGRVRMQGELALPLAAAAGRLYVAAGPSVLWLPERLSTTRISFGGYGAAGIELFAGDGYRTYPVAFYFEVGVAAHTASQDVASRTGPVEETDLTVDRPIGTGFAVHGGLRFYLWR